MCGNKIKVRLFLWKRDCSGKESPRGLTCIFNLLFLELGGRYTDVHCARICIFYMLERLYNVFMHNFLSSTFVKCGGFFISQIDLFCFLSF